MRCRQQQQHEGGNKNAYMIRWGRSLPTTPHTQGNDGLLPASTPAGRQNPGTLASSTSLLNVFSILWENDRPCGRRLLFDFPRLGGTAGTEIQVECVAFAFIFVGGRDLGDEVIVLGDDGEEDDDSNNFATKLAHRRKEEEEHLEVVGEGVEGDDSWGSEVKSVLSPDGVSVGGGGVDNGDEINSFGLLPVLDLRNRPSDRIRARGESRFFPTLSFALLEPSRRSGVLLFSPRNSTGRRCRAPSKLVDRLW